MIGDQCSDVRPRRPRPECGGSRLPRWETAFPRAAAEPATGCATGSDPSPGFARIASQHRCSPHPARPTVFVPAAPALAADDRARIGRWACPGPDRPGGAPESGGTRSAAAGPAWPGGPTRKRRGRETIQNPQPGRLGDREEEVGGRTRGSRGGHICADEYTEDVSERKRRLPRNL